MLQKNLLNYRIDVGISTDSVRPFKSILELKSVDYSFVGEYYCIHAEFNNSNENMFNELRATFKLSSIYLFVDGNYYCCIV